ncbi:hypothetical protein PIB30_049301 [Stylosanthes scabra]|uniref:Uncharacterized protein n=1 Tax=Stylosanthes scabra TaxID=79078 RepID=A0ABU6RHB6_9FABA|nr:hypothetical protein [Stylosanthes scabra]
MAIKGIYVVMYLNRKISQSAEGVKFFCKDSIWVSIPTQTSLQELKSLILLNLGELGRKEISRVSYRMSIALQNVGGSSSSSNNVDSGRGFETNEGTRTLSNYRASSPSFRPYINQSVHAPPPVVPTFEEDVQPGMMESPDRDDYQSERG